MASVEEQRQRMQQFTAECSETYQNKFNVHIGNEYSLKELSPHLVIMHLIRQHLSIGIHNNDALALSRCQAFIVGKVGNDVNSFPTTFDPQATYPTYNLEDDSSLAFIAIDAPTQKHLTTNYK